MVLADVQHTAPSAIMNVVFFTLVAPLHANRDHAIANALRKFPVLCLQFNIDVPTASRR